MSKAIFKFKLPEEQEELDVYTKAGSMHHVIFQFLNDTRSKVKYELEEDDDLIPGIEWCREKIAKLIEEEEINSLF